MGERDLSWTMREEKDGAVGKSKEKSMNNSTEEDCGSCGHTVWGLELEELGPEGGWCKKQQRRATGGWPEWRSDLPKVTRLASRRTGRRTQCTRIPAQGSSSRPTVAGAAVPVVLLARSVDPGL